MNFLKGSEFKYEDEWKYFPAEILSSFQNFLDGPEGYAATAERNPMSTLDYFFFKSLKKFLASDLVSFEDKQEIKNFLQVFKGTQASLNEYMQALYPIVQHLYASQNILDACSGLGLSSVMLADILREGQVTSLDPVIAIAEKMETIPNVTGIADSMSNQAQLFKDADIILLSAPCDGMEEAVLRSLDNKKPFFAMACECPEEINKLRRLNSLQRDTKILRFPVKMLGDKEKIYFKHGITNLRVSSENSDVQLEEDKNNAKLDEGYSMV